MTKHTCIGLILAALTCSTAHAGLIGHTMRVWHELPTQGAIIWGPSDVVAGAGVDVTLVAGIYNIDFYDVNATDSELLITFPNSCCGGFGANAFNGLHVQDMSGNGWTSVSFSSNFGFPSGRITFDPDELYVNFAGLNPNPATAQLIVTLSTPEPSTWVLVAAGVAVGWWRRKSVRV